jgi:uncharacterized membrane protein
MNTSVKSHLYTKNLVIMALFIALSFAGSYLKVFGTIAFDSLPGFLAALLFGSAIGAAIGFLGHFFTALTSGFPLSFPLHMVIAASMAVTMLGFGLTYRALKGKIPEMGNLVVTGIVGVLLNGPVSLALSMGTLTLIAGWEAAVGLLAMLPALILAAAANVVISLLVFKPLNAVKDKRL